MLIGIGVVVDAGRRVHHLQHLLDHGRPADQGARPAADARCIAPTAARERDGGGAARGRDRVDPRRRGRARRGEGHRRAVRRHRLRPAGRRHAPVDRHGDPRAAGRHRRHAGRVVRPGVALHPDPARGGDPRGRAAAARLAGPEGQDPRSDRRRPRPGAGRARAVRGVRHGAGAAAARGGRAAAPVRRRADRAVRGAGAGPRDRLARRALRRHSRPHRPRERRAQPVAHGRHRRGVDDRHLPRQLRRGVRRGPEEEHHRRARYRPEGAAVRDELGRRRWRLHAAAARAGRPDREGARRGRRCADQLRVGEAPARRRRTSRSRRRRRRSSTPTGCAGSRAPTT